MRNLTFLAVLSVVLLFSCSKPDYETEILVESFPIEETLSGTRIDLAESEYISNIAYFAGDYLVFRAIRDNYFLQIYDREFNLVGKVLNKGEGPEELPDATWQGQWSGSESNPEVLVFCDPKKRLAKLNIHPFAGLTTVCDIPVSEGLDPSCIYQTSDTTLMGISLSIGAGSSLFCYNTETQSVRLAESPFEFAGGTTAFYTTQQVMDYNAEKKEICCSYLSFPSMVIYDYNFNVLRKIHIGEQVNTATLNYGDKYPELSSVRYYKDFLLVLMSHPDTDECKLLVFDSDGTPRASYAIGSAIGYVVDDVAKRILSVKYDSANDIVYLDSHEMPAILK